MKRKKLLPALSDDVALRITTSEVQTQLKRLLVLDQQTLVPVELLVERANPKQLAIPKKMSMEL